MLQILPLVGLNAFEAPKVIAAPMAHAVDTGAVVRSAPQLPAAMLWSATFFAIAQTRASMNSDVEVRSTADPGADFDTGLDAELDTAMADDFYKGLHAGGSAALRRGPALRANCRGDPGKIGAGEGIRTLDPDLGKVVL